jgi:hypothetical protein
MISTRQSTRALTLRRLSPLSDLRRVVALRGQRFFARSSEVHFTVVWAAVPLLPLVFCLRGHCNHTAWGTSGERTGTLASDAVQPLEPWGRRRRSRVEALSG